MSSYPNMTYCMIKAIAAARRGAINENTLAAMNQIVTAMNDEGPAFLQEMIREERRAFQALFSVCEDFISLSEELVEQEERDARAAARDVGAHRVKHYLEDKEE